MSMHGNSCPNLDCAWRTLFTSVWNSQIDHLPLLPDSWGHKGHRRHGHERCASVFSVWAGVGWWQKKLPEPSAVQPHLRQEWDIAPHSPQSLDCTQPTTCSIMSTCISSLWHIGASFFICLTEATTTSQLKISRLNQYRGPCTGKTEIYMLCDKVQKGKLDRTLSWRGSPLTMASLVLSCFLIAPAQKKIT